MYKRGKRSDPLRTCLHACIALRVIPITLRRCLYKYVLCLYDSEDFAELAAQLSFQGYRHVDVKTHFPPFLYFHPHWDETYPCNLLFHSNMKIHL